jgi:hypothetical protein
MSGRNENYGNEQRRAGPVAPEKKPPEYYDEMDKRTREKEEKATTTKKTMGESFKKGGSIRGGGCETKGKTKGRMV